MVKRQFRRLLIGLLASVPLLGQPLPSAAETSAGSLYGLGPSTIVTIDPVTGATSTFAELPQVDTFPGAFFNNLASDAAGHRLFTNRTYYSEDFTPHYQIVTIDTTTAGVSLSPDMTSGLSGLVYDPATRALFGQTNMCCPFQLVRIDSTTGAQTHVVDIPGIQPLRMTAAADKQSIYMPTEDFDPNTFQPIVTILTINTSTGAITQSPPIATGIFALVYDSSSRALFGKTFCCPASLVQVNPTTGAETTIVSDLPIGSGITIDSATHTVYMTDDEFGAFDFFQLIKAVNDQTGAVSTSTGELPRDTYIGSLAFEGVVVTADAVIAEVNAALASGAVSNAGVGASLIAELRAGSAAQTRGDCAAALRIYQAFVNDVLAQSGKTIDRATAAKLAADASSVTCP